MATLWAVVSIRPAESMRGYSTSSPLNDIEFLLDVRISLLFHASIIAQTVVYSELMTTIDQLNARSEGYLPGLLGIEFLTLKPGRLTSRLPLRSELLAPNGYLHAAAVIALADTACGYGTFTDLPEGAHNFTTIELKSNFLGTTRQGVIACVATRVHSGRTTQIWDATVSDEASGKTIALFRCTQLILYPRV